jgi:hypothetical protein
VGDDAVEADRGERQGRRGEEADIRWRAIEVPRMPSIVRT